MAAQHVIGKKRILTSAQSLPTMFKIRLGTASIVSSLMQSHSRKRSRLLLCRTRWSVSGVGPRYSLILRPHRALRHLQPPYHVHEPLLLEAVEAAVLVHVAR